MSTERTPNKLWKIEIIERKFDIVHSLNGSMLIHYKQLANKAHSQFITQNLYLATSVLNYMCM